jgi:hypothetical protein
MSIKPTNRRTVTRGASISQINCKAANDLICRDTGDLLRQIGVLAAS